MKIIWSHTFKSEEHRAKHLKPQASLLWNTCVNTEERQCIPQMAGGNPDEMVTYCWWKAESPAAILSMLGEMAELYHNDIKEMPMVANVAD